MHATVAVPQGQEWSASGGWQPSHFDDGCTVAPGGHADVRSEGSIASAAALGVLGRWADGRAQRAGGWGVSDTAALPSDDAWTATASDGRSRSAPDVHGTATACSTAPAAAHGATFSPRPEVLVDWVYAIIH